MQNSNIIILILYVMTIFTSALGQGVENVFLRKMQTYELDIENTYTEYQRLYYEKKSSEAELSALEHTISAYVDQIMELYETLVLSGIQELETGRDIAARALVFRTLTHLEKAPLNVEYYEKACYDYYKALNLYENTNEIPALFKSLPRELWVGNRRYTRLIELLEVKGKDLFCFGRVDFQFRNFKVTSNLNPNLMEFVRFKSTPSHFKYTYKFAEGLFQNAFKETLKEKGHASFYLALPEGSYFIRSRAGIEPLQVHLSALYVRGNQRHSYIVEPIGNWIILYENPNSRRPDFYKYRKTKSTWASGGGDAHSSSEPRSTSNPEGSANSPGSDQELVGLVSEIVRDYMEKIEITLMFDLKDPWFKGRFIEIASDIIVKQAQSSHFFDSWSTWTLAWETAKLITTTVSPGRQVSNEMIQLTYAVFNEL